MARKRRNDDQDDNPILTAEVRAAVDAAAAAARERADAFRDEWTERLQRPTVRPASAFPTSVLHRHGEKCKTMCPVFSRPAVVS